MKIEALKSGSSIRSQIDQHNGKDPSFAKLLENALKKKSNKK